MFLSLQPARGIVHASISQRVITQLCSQCCMASRSIWLRLLAILHLWIPSHLVHHISHGLAKPPIPDTIILLRRTLKGWTSLHACTTQRARLYW